MPLLRRNFILLILCTSLLSVFGQNSQAVRLEVPSNIDVDSYHLESLGELGALIFYESSEVNKEGKRKWYFALFDTSLTQDWLKFVDLSDKIEFVEARRTQKKLHLLFMNTSRSRFDHGFYEIVSYDIRTQNFNLISGAVPEKASIAGFEVIGNKACIGLNLRKNITDILFIDLQNGEINPVHIMPDSQNMIMHLQADQDNNQFFCVLKVNRDKRYLQDYILSFNAKGEQKERMEVDSDNNSKLLHHFILRPDRGGNLEVFGTFDIIGGRVANFKDLENDDDAKGAGVFYLAFEKANLVKQHYYDFINLDNIPGSLQGRAIKNIRRADNNKLPDVKPYTAYYHLYDPQLLELTDQYVLSVELYTPHYRTETRMDYDFYGRPYPTSYNVFDGYEFYDVVLLGLDKQGSLLWNNDFTLRNVKTFSLQRHSLVFEDDTYISIAYINDGKIIAHTINGSVDVDGDEVPIEGRFYRDNTVRDENNHIIKWYARYMLIYGYQQINNRSLNDQNERTVFYVNKIAYQ